MGDEHHNSSVGNVHTDNSIAGYDDYSQHNQMLAGLPPQHGAFPATPAFATGAFPKGGGNIHHVMLKQNNDKTNGDDEEFDDAETADNDNHHE